MHLRIPFVLVHNSSNKEELISIIMPSWNRANIISEAIASVARTYANWELLIVDDGSSDETADYRGNFAAEPIRRIKVLSN